MLQGLGMALREPPRRTHRRTIVNETQRPHMFGPSPSEGMGEFFAYHMPVAGMGEYFSGVGADDTAASADDYFSQPRLISMGIGAVVGLGLGWFAFSKKGYKANATKRKGGKRSAARSKKSGGIFARYGVGDAFLPARFDSETGHEFKTPHVMSRSGRVYPDTRAGYNRAIADANRL